MRALITGITGFVGSHLADLLLAEGIEVWGTYRRRSPRENISHIEDRLHLVEMDLRDSASVIYALKEAQPDWVFHLAAQSFVPTSWRAPGETIEVNVMGQVHLLEGLRTLGMKPRFLVAGSSEEYGLVRPEETPITEDNPLRPLSPYGVSKVAQDLLGFQYFRSYGLPVIRTRAFNHEGPRRGVAFVTSNFARQFARMKKGKAPPVLKVGNLDAIRDYTDVRDTVRAYRLAIEKCEPGEVYNICSGRGFRIRDIIHILQEISGMAPDTETDASRMRPSDVPILIGNASRFREATGWTPTIPFEKTMSDLYHYWLEREA
ncbi:MAG: GDP-mannose 4,6-dehydratase [bacterium JZ-2024 1]